jgi:hypothetical protein
MSTSGGSNAATSMGQWSDSIAPFWANALSWGQGLTQQTNPDGSPGFGQYKPYTGEVQGLRDTSSGNGWFASNPGQRIAGLTGDQEAAANNTRTFLNQEWNPAATMNRANDRLDAYGHPIANSGSAINGAIGQTEDTLGGQYLTGPNANPYSRNNPIANASSNFAGYSPQFRGVMDEGANDITQKYQQGTAADTTRMFNMAGAFGGSAHQQAMANNEAGLGKTLKDYYGGMLNDQWNRSANLEQQDFARQGQLNDSFLNRGSQNYENERQRQMGAIGLGDNQQSLALQRAQAQMGIGDMFRGYNQDLLNQGYGDFTDRSNQQYKMLDIMSGLLGRASGGMSPSFTQTSSGYSASPYSQLIGAGLLGHAGGLY